MRNVTDHVCAQLADTKLFTCNSRRGWKRSTDVSSIVLEDLTTLYPNFLPLTDLQGYPGKGRGGQEGLVLAGTSHHANKLGAGCQDAGTLLRQVDPGHGRHVVDVIIIPACR